MMAANEAQLLVGSTDYVTSSLPMLPGFFGNVSAVDVRMRTPSTALPDAWDSATLDATSVTAAAASKGATSIGYTGSPTIVEGRALAIAPAGALGVVPIVVEVERHDAGADVIYLREPLPRAVAAGELIKGWTVYHQATTSETSDAGEGLALWRVSLTSSAFGIGAAYTWHEQIRIVNQMARPYSLTPERLGRLRPIFHRYLPPHDVDGRESIEVAWTSRLVPDLEVRGIDVTRVKSHSRLEFVHAEAVLALLVGQSEDAGPDFREERRQQYADALEVVLAGKHFWYDDEDEASPRVEGVPTVGDSSARLTR